MLTVSLHKLLLVHLYLQQLNSPETTQFCTSGAYVAVCVVLVDTFCEIMCIRQDYRMFKFRDMFTILFIMRYELKIMIVYLILLCIAILELLHTSI